jgi:hypothetical protein
MPCAFEEMTFDWDEIKFYCPVIRGFDNKLFARAGLFMIYPFVMLCVMSA